MAVGIGSVGEDPGWVVGASGGVSVARSEITIGTRTTLVDSAWTLSGLGSVVEVAGTAGLGLSASGDMLASSAELIGVWSAGVSGCSWQLASSQADKIMRDNRERFLKVSFRLIGF